MSTPAARNSRTRCVAAAEAVSRARATRADRNDMGFPSLVSLTTPRRADRRRHRGPLSRGHLFRRKQLVLLQEFDHVLIEEPRLLELTRVSGPVQGLHLAAGDEL